jgi:hypothetical protein
MKKNDTVTLDIIEDFLKDCIADLKREGRELSFASRYGRTVVHVEPRNDQTGDGNTVSDRVIIRTALPEQLQVLKTSSVSVANQLTGLSAVIRDPSAYLVLISRLTFYEIDNQDPRIYMSMISFAAGMQAEINFGALSYSRGLAFPIDLPGKTNPSHWGPESFASVARLLRRDGLFCNADSSGLTVEFPWDPGAVSAAVGHRTSLLMMHRNMVHPVLGNGLFFRLALPQRFEEKLSFDVLNAMNVADAYAVNAPPFFGAWCADQRGEFLNYIGFWPNMLYRPGTVRAITQWMMARSVMAKEILERAEGKGEIQPTRQGGSSAWTRY